MSQQKNDIQEYSPRFINILESQDEIIEDLMKELELCKREMAQISGRGEKNQRKGEILKKEIVNNNIIGSIQKKMNYVVEMIDDLQSQNYKLEKDVSQIKEIKIDEGGNKYVQDLYVDLHKVKGEVEILRNDIRVKDEITKRVFDSIDDQDRKLNGAITNIYRQLEEYKNCNDKLREELGKLIDEKKELEKNFEKLKNERVNVSNSGSLSNNIHDEEDNEVRRLIEEQKWLIESLKKENELMTKKMNNMDNAFQHRVSKLRREKRSLKTLLKKHFNESPEI
uniref:Leucine zipper transcription factor-like protein 1 n=1 Tax=Parastrongyloides trichosuri TaxID=131310 RepID=A0A0N4ZDK5_PARTI